MVGYLWHFLIWIPDGKRKLGYYYKKMLIMGLALGSSFPSFALCKSCVFLAEILSIYAVSLWQVVDAYMIPWIWNFVRGRWESNFQQYYQSYYSALMYCPDLRKTTAAASVIQDGTWHRTWGWIIIFCNGFWMRIAASCVFMLLHLSSSYKLSDHGQGISVYYSKMGQTIIVGLLMKILGDTLPLFKEYRYVDDFM